MAKVELPSKIRKAISDFTIGTGGEARLPVHHIIPEGNFVRTDNGNNIFREGAKLFGVFVNKTARSTLTLNPSPHVPDKIPAETVKNVSTRKFGIIPDLGDLTQIGPHLVAWWQKLDLPTQNSDKAQTGSRSDMLGLAQLPDVERIDYFAAISQQIEDGINLLADCLGLSDDLLENIRVYGLFGHATIEERMMMGLSRGAQSAPDGHLNIVYLPEETRKKTTPEDVKTKDMVKQIGAWDTVVEDLFGSGIQRVIQNTALHRLNPHDRVEDNPIYVTRVSNKTTSSDFSHMNFFEGFKVGFDKAITIDQSLGVLTDILKKGSDLYTSALSSYEEYYKNINNPNKKKIIFDNLKASAKAFGFNNNMAKEFVKFVFSIRPTHGQLNKWIHEIETDQQPQTNPKMETPTYEDNNLVYLKNLKHKYERIVRKLGETGGQKNYLENIQRIYSLSTKDAELFESIIEDRFKIIDENLNNISSIMAPFLSGSYMFDYVRDTTGKIMVKGLSLSTRLGTDKGVVEDLGGYVIDRATAA